MQRSACKDARTAPWAELSTRAGRHEATKARKLRGPERKFNIRYGEAEAVAEAEAEARRGGGGATAARSLSLFDLSLVTALTQKSYG